MTAPHGVGETMELVSEPGEQQPPLSPSAKRLGHGVRDMVLTMVGLAVVVLLIVGLQGGWSLSAGRPKVDQAKVPKQNATKQLTTVAGDMSFPVRVPRLPSTWRSNSGDVQPVEQHSAVRTGWVTPGNGYLRLVQSDAAAGALVAAAAEASGSRPDAIGKHRAGGLTWRSYPAVRNEHSWVYDTGKVRLLVTGNAPESQFRTLAAAVAGAKPAK